MEREYVGQNDRHEGCHSERMVIDTAFDDEAAMVMPIPLGDSDFGKLRGKGMHMVDKSLFIRRILLMKSWNVFLFTRPRRFGKSTNLNMLDEFLNRKKSGKVANPETGEEKDAFEGMRISMDEGLCRTYRNRLPVVHLDFKDISSMNFEGYLRGFGSVIGRLYADNTDVLDGSLDGSYLDKFMRIKNGRADETDLQDSIRFMTMLMHRAYGRGAVVLIDEYENSIHGMDDSMPADGSPWSDRDRTVMFLRRTLGSALKSNTHLELGVLTGITEIVEHDLFSGLNNIYRNTVLTRDRRGMSTFGDCFGFTEDEVRRMISDYGGDEHDFETAADWYNGYDFGLGRMFNPLSINGFVNAGFEPGPYWSETSANSVLRNFSQCLDDDTVDLLTGLLGGSVVPLEHIGRDLTYSRAPQASDLMTLMVYSGYLNAEKHDFGYLARLPNREIMMTFGGEVLNMLKDELSLRDAGAFTARLGNAVRKGDADMLKDVLDSMMAVCADPKTMTTENAFRMFVAGASTALTNGYAVQTERMSGKGYSDLVLESRDGRFPHAVIEFKRRPKGSGKPLGELAEEALKQIDDKGYALSLKGAVSCFGIAFEGKEIAVRKSERRDGAA